MKELEKIIKELLSTVKKIEKLEEKEGETKYNLGEFIGGDVKIDIVKKDNMIHTNIKGMPLDLLVILNKKIEEIQKEIGMSDEALKEFLDSVTVIEGEEC